jgi:CelD/BcsL family acetyltransferase involved in cellulose biosynthesis
MKPLNKYMTHSTLEFTIIRDRTHFEKMRSVWNAFLEKSVLDSFFLRHEWLYTWWNVYGKDTSNELFIIALYATDKLVAIAPFYIDKTLPVLSGGGKILRFIGQGTVWKQTAQSERQDIIIDSGYSVDRVLAELADFIHQHRSKWYAASFMLFSKNQIYIN